MLVLDAVSRKLQQGAKVYSFCQGSLHNSPFDLDLTDATGIAMLEYHCTDAEKLHLSVISPRKEQCGEPDPLTLKQIESVGFVANPNGPEMSCTTKISQKTEARSRTSSPVPKETELVAVSF